MGFGAAEPFSSAAIMLRRLLLSRSEARSLKLVGCGYAGGANVTISELGSLGEFVSSIAVVVTLIYLATQLRQTTKAIRAASTQALDQSITGNICFVGVHPRGRSSHGAGLERSRVALRGRGVHFQTLIAAFFLTMDSSFWSYRNSLLPVELWEREQEVIRTWVNRPGGRIAWEQKRSQVSKPFREYVEANLRDDP